MRTFNPDIPNRIANHPDVVRQLGWNPEDHPETNGWLLLGDQVADRDRWVFLVNETEDFCFMFEWSAPGVYQMHTAALPSCRGKRAVKAGKQLLHEMFTQHGADMVWGMTPLDNKAARLFNRWVGGVSCGFGEHHVSGPVEYFRNSRARWLQDHWKK